MFGGSNPNLKMLKQQSYWKTNCSSWFEWVTDYNIFLDTEKKSSKTGDLGYDIIELICSLAKINPQIMRVTGANSAVDEKHKPEKYCKENV